MSGAHAGSPAENIAVMDFTTGTASSTPLASGAVRMRNVGKALFILKTGDMAAETIDFKLQACDSGGANPVDISGKAITQLAAHATNNDNKLALIAVDEADLIASGKEYVRGLVTTGGVTGGVCSIVALATHFNGPAANVDSSAVVQIVP